MGVVALVVVVVATTYVMKKRKAKTNYRKKLVNYRGNLSFTLSAHRKLSNMLNMLSDPNGSSSDDSFGDNPEDDNLFDRLERQYQ